MADITEVKLSYRNLTPQQVAAIDTLNLGLAVGTA